MKIDILLFQFAIVFLPGLIWAQLDARYAMKEKPGPAEFFVRVLLFGLVTYAVGYCLYTSLGCSFSLLEFSDSDSKQLLSQEFFDEIITSVPVSFILAVLWIYAATYKWLTRLLHKIRATNKFGDEDVWDYAFNLKNPVTSYVHIRDFRQGLIYSGWVAAFSETGKLREILLTDAIVYDYLRKETQIPLIYLTLEKTNIHIEFPYQEQHQDSEGE